MKVKDWRTIMAIILFEKYGDRVKVSSYKNLSKVKEELKNLHWVVYFDNEWEEIWPNGTNPGPDGPDGPTGPIAPPK